MVPCCPRCGYRYEREEGFFLGVYVMNVVIGAVLAPLVFYPFSKTLWVAIELIMRPADAVEPADAQP